MGRIRFALLVIAVLVGVAAKPSSAAPTTTGQCIQELARAGVAGRDVNPSNANFVTGTNGDDSFQAELTAGQDVVCGFGGDDEMIFVQETDVFLGGQGADRALFIQGGTFVGGAGRDAVVSFLAGTFDGGEDGDWVDVMAGGMFLGGEGNDAVGRMSGGSFSGAAGSDWVGFMFGGVFGGGEGDDSVGYLERGTFNGGAGNDVVQALGTGGTFNQD